LEGPNLRLDHLRLAVPDADAATAALEGLGFAVRAPTGVAWRAVVFAFEHLELVPAPDHGLMAVGVGDVRDRPAANDAAPPTRRIDGEPPITFAERDLGVAGLPVVHARTLTAEALRPVSALRHPNRALALVGATLVVPDPAAVAVALAPVLGDARITRTDAVVAVHLGVTTLLLAAPSDAELLHPDLPDDVEEGATAPRVVSLAIGVADTERAASVLAERGRTVRRRPDGSLGVAVPALGLSLEFRTTA
jgi:hypothetical protein